MSVLQRVLNRIAGPAPSRGNARVRDFVPPPAPIAPQVDRQVQAIGLRALALRRQRDLAGMNIFKGAEQSRLTLDWVAQSLPADDELRWTIRQLRNRARDLARNNGTIRKWRNLMATNVIGANGAQLKPRVHSSSGAPATEINRSIRAAWKDWSESPVTVDGQLDLIEVQHLALKTLITEGELIMRFYRDAVNPHGLALQFIDADMLDEEYNLPRGNGVHNGNEVRLGVEVDQLGKPLAYHVLRHPTQPYSAPSIRDRIPADEILHLFLRERVNQTRGYAWVHAIMFDLKMLGGYVEAETVAARIAAAKMFFFVNKQPAAGEYSSGDAPSSMDANPGSSEALTPGWEVQTLDPQHPNSAFPDFVKGAMRRISAGIDTSYDELANDLSGVNFSSIRSGKISERDFFRLLQAWWSRKFLGVVYREWLGMALLRSTLELPSRDWRRFTAHTFTPRGWDWVDPKADIEASSIAVHQGFTTLTRVLAERGIDLDDLLEERKAELAALKAAGITIAPPPGTGSEPAGAKKSAGGGDAGDDDEPADDDAARSLVPHRNGHTHRPPPSRLLPA